MEELAKGELMGLSGIYRLIVCNCLDSKCSDNTYCINLRGIKRGNVKSDLILNNVEIDNMLQNNNSAIGRLKGINEKIESKVDFHDTVTPFYDTIDFTEAVKFLNSEGHVN